MTDTFLFDLDGTLLPLDMDHFIRLYFGEMGKSFADIIDPKHLIDCILKATNAMIASTEHRTNEEVFMENFFSLLKVGYDREEYLKRFHAYYDSGFLKSKESVGYSHIMVEAVRLIKSKGYDVIVATNPLFPRKAILHRLSWAGFSEDDFIHITDYETSHYCKPNPQYYQEILQVCSKQGSQCMMVGNDVQEDLVAAKLGLQTYLITDHILNRTGEEPACTYKGTYSDFYEFARKLPEI